MSNININVKVNNSSANARLKQLHSQVAKVGKATDDVAKSFVNFNRTIFGATAFLGIFTQAFQGLANVMMQGSELDRASAQFAKRFGSELPSQMQKFDDGTSAVIGPQGRFIQNIRSMTTNSIDMMAAMRAAIQLRSSGVSGDINVLSEIVARAGTAAKMAGKDSAEGIKRVTDFLKDGSLAHLQHLGLLREVNPELKAQLAILGKATGVLSTAVTASYKLALGMRILREATKGQLKGQRDLRDTLQDTAQFFVMLKGTIGSFVGKAIQPLLESFIDFSLQATMILEDIKNNKKEILFLAKAFIIGTAAVAGFVLVVGGLRLAVTALTSLVGGIPFLTIALGAMAAAILYNKVSMKGLVEVAQTLGAIVQGSFQLIHSFLSDPENFAKGIGKMDKSIHDLLKSKGLLGLVTNIARVGSVVTVFVQSTVRGFMSALNNMLDKLGSVGSRLKSFLGLDSGPWKRDWLETAKALGEAFGKVSLSLLGVWAAFKLLKTGGKIFSGFGKAKNLLSGAKGGKGSIAKGLSGGGPKGTAMDPFFVIAVKQPWNMVGAIPGIGGAKGKPGLLSKIAKGGRTAALAGMIRFPALAKVADVGTKAGSGILGTFKKLFKPLGKILSPVIGLLGRLAPILRPLIGILGGVARFTVIGTIITTVGTFLWGFVEGLLEAKDGIGKFVTGVSEWVSHLFETNPILIQVKSAFEFLYNGLAMVFNKIREWGQKVGLAMGEAMGGLGQSAHDSVLNDKMAAAKEMRQNTGASMLGEDFMRFRQIGSRESMIPNMPEGGGTDTVKLAMIQEALERVNESEKGRMEKAFRDAVSLDGGDGTMTITREEWEEIFAGGMDKSKTLKEVAKSGEKTKDNTGDGIVGSARQGVC